MLDRSDIPLILAAVMVGVLLHYNVGFAAWPITTFVAALFVVPEFATILYRRRS